MFLRSSGRRRLRRGDCAAGRAVLATLAPGAVALPYDRGPHERRRTTQGKAAQRQAMTPARASILALVAALLLGGCASTPPPGPPTPEQRTGAVEALVVERQWLESWFKGTPVRIAQRPDGAIDIDVPREFCFDAGSSAVKPALAAVLDKLAESLRRVPLARVPLIAAPADAATAPSLALQRAQQVRDGLRSRGVSRSPPRQPGGGSRGDRPPARDGRGALSRHGTGRASENRRALGSSDPPMLQLHYFPGNASLIPHIVLEELGETFELKYVDRAVASAQVRAVPRAQSERPDSGARRHRATCRSRSCSTKRPPSACIWPIRTPPRRSCHRSPRWSAPTPTSGCPGSPPRCRPPSSSTSIPSVGPTTRSPSPR